MSNAAYNLGKLLIALESENAKKYGVSLILKISGRTMDAEDKITLYDIGADTIQRCVKMIEVDARLRLRKARIDQVYELEQSAKRLLEQAERYRIGAP